MTPYSRRFVAGGVVTTVIGLVSLLGWAFDHAALASAIPAFSAMTFNTALCFVLLGLALLLPESWRPIRLGCAAIVGLFATLMLAQLVFGMNLGIDNLLFNHSTAYPDNPYPGRMAPTTIIAFICSSIATQLIIFGCHNSCFYNSRIISFN